MAEQVEHVFFFNQVMDPFHGFNPFHSRISYWFSLFWYERTNNARVLHTHWSYQSYLFRIPSIVSHDVFSFLKWQTNDNDKYNHKEKDSCRFFDLQQYWNEYHSYNNDFDLYFYLLMLEKEFHLKKWNGSHSLVPTAYSQWHPLPGTKSFSNFGMSRMSSVGLINLMTTSDWIWTRFYTFWNGHCLKNSAETTTENIQKINFSLFPSYFFGFCSYCGLSFIHRPRKLWKL